MTQQHPITPPPELLQEWCQQGHNCISELDALKELATQAARWGADRELEACCEWIADNSLHHAESDLLKDLRAARRPKPPSLKEESLALIDKIQGSKEAWDISDLNVVRRALESLPS